MRCFTDEELRRGLDHVIGYWDRCVVCRGGKDDPHDQQPHAFTVADPLDLFLEAVRATDERGGL